MKRWAIRSCSYNLSRQDWRISVPEQAALWLVCNWKLELGMELSVISYTRSRAITRCFGLDP